MNTQSGQTCHMMQNVRGVPKWFQVNVCVWSNCTSTQFFLNIYFVLVLYLSKVYGQKYISTRVLMRCDDCLCTFPCEVRRGLPVLSPHTRGRLMSLLLAADGKSLRTLGNGQFVVTTATTLVSSILAVMM